MSEGEPRRLEVTRLMIPMTYDIDIEDHVNNIVYIRWMEEMRYLWLETFASFRSLLERDIAPVILETNIRYKRAVRLFEEVHASVWVRELKRARFTLDFEFTVEGEIAAEAVQHGAWLNVATGRPVRTPPEIFRLQER